MPSQDVPLPLPTTLSVDQTARFWERLDAALETAERADCEDAFSMIDRLMYLEELHTLCPGPVVKPAELSTALANISIPLLSNENPQRERAKEVAILVRGIVGDMLHEVCDPAPSAEAAAEGISPPRIATSGTASKGAGSGKTL